MTFPASTELLSSTSRFGRLLGGSSTWVRCGLAVITLLAAQTIASSGALSQAPSTMPQAGQSGIVVKVRFDGDYLQVDEFLKRFAASLLRHDPPSVTTERLPPGWRVVLDPGRPKVLNPGQRYLGFAQVAIPAGASAGEGIVSIHGVLTPQRPGARRPIGSGVTYHVKYAPPDRLHPEAVGLIRSHEELLKGQQRLLEKLGTVYWRS
jgi:hypothetical protein